MSSLNHVFYRPEVFLLLNIQRISKFSISLLKKSSRIYVVSNVRALRACLDPNGSAYQVDLPMTSEPFPRRIGLFESLSIPVDRLLITISVYTTDLGFQQFTFFFDSAYAAKLPTLHPLMCVYRCNDLIGQYADRGKTCTNLYKKAM